MYMCLKYEQSSERSWETAYRLGIRACGKVRRDPFGGGTGVTDADNDSEVLAAIDCMFKLALSNQPVERIGTAALEIRARATLALALFVPHVQTRRNLTTLMTSPEVPETIRSLASEALTNWSS